VKYTFILSSFFPEFHLAKVKVLPDIVANKIAAGEVVERPASVVKELVENAVDAGATAIIVEIQDGGKRLIRVSDNGEGMGSDDALLAIERHATSKIQSVEDIENIVTLGFRGEALPSIVSVSRAVIDTRREGDTFGTRLVIEGGVLKQVSDIGRDRGTDVEIRNLFYNLPARRKFLSTEATELKHIRGILYDYAVASPGISLSLVSNGSEIFLFRGCVSRGEMLQYIFGETLADLMVPLKVSVEGTEISGFIGKPESARASGINQYIVMNSRPIRSRTISRAVIEGYGPTVARGMFPPFVLYFETDPSRVDVNVHPTKREVRIHREFPLLQALRETVAEAIQSMAAAPELTAPRWPFSDYRQKTTPITMYNPPDDHWQNDIPRVPQKPGIESQTGMIFPSTESGSLNGNFSPGFTESVQSYESPSFWQLKDKYIITTVKEGAIIIDQHVAHERILYEETLGHIQGRHAPAQQLLFPLTLDFSAADFDILVQMIPFLNQIGFGVREFGDRSIIVDAIPSGMTEFGEGRIFSEFIEEMRIHGKITSGYMEKFAAAVACRSAIKAGKPLNQVEMQYLVDKLFATRSPFVCPHGRPTIVKLTLEELDRRFGR
jgi:DNA mismatch repair protein MutL